MAIDGIGAGSGLWGIQGMGNLPSRPEGVEGMPFPEDSAQVSALGEKMQELATLAKDDPEAFKQATAAITEDLDNQAGEASGFKADALKHMADKFSEASETGSMEALRPDGPPTGQRGGQAMGARPSRDAFEEVMSIMTTAVEDGLQGSGETAA